MFSRFSSLLRQVTAIKSPYCLVQTAGVKSFERPIKFENIEYPEKARLQLLPKVPQYHPSIKPFKMQKRLRLMRGPELVHNTFQHKQFGVVAEIGGRLKHAHFEMARLTVARLLPKKGFAVWRVPPPWQPVSKKGHGMRMGGGKAAINHYVTPLKAGRVILEVGGEIEYKEVKRMLEVIAKKLPFKAKAFTNEELENKFAEEKWLEENNQNYWTYKYVVQNNLLGCSNWICPVDRVWFGKHR